MTDNIIATERKRNDRQYNSDKEKQMTDNIIATERKTKHRTQDTGRRQTKH
jgi:hypothetical protein